MFYRHANIQRTYKLTSFILWIVLCVSNVRYEGTIFNKGSHLLVEYQYLHLTRFNNRQFQLLVYACRGRWEVRYHIADYAEKNRNGGRVNTE
jgi:hypothetical protein